MLELSERFRAGVLVCAVACAGSGVGIAQGGGVGCDGPVTAVTGQSGPCTELAVQIEGLLADPAVARAHWGIAVVGLDGTPIYSLK